MISVAGYSQFPGTQSQGSPNTLNRAKGAFGSDSGYVFLRNFPDTITANLGFLKNIPNIVIVINDQLWKRNNAATAWVKSSDPTWQETLITGSTLTQNNTIAGGGFDFRWNNIDTMWLNGTGEAQRAVLALDSGLFIYRGEGVETYRMYIESGADKGIRLLTPINNGVEIIPGITGGYLVIDSGSLGGVKLNFVSSGSTTVGRIALNAVMDEFSIRALGLDTLVLYGPAKMKETVVSSSAGDSVLVVDANRMIRTRAQSDVSGGGGGSPGGSDTHVQYNDGGAFGGEAGMTYNETTNTLSTGVYHSAISSTSAPGYAFSADGTGTVSGLGYISGNILMFTAGAASLVLTHSLLNFRVPSNYQYSWSSATDNLSSSDAGISRLAAAKIGVGNGTAGTSGGTFVAGNIGIGQTSPTAYLHLAAGTTTASTSPLKFTSGSLNTTAEAGAVEFLTDKWYGTITTGAARKEFTMNDAPLTSGTVPVATTNGRLTDGIIITASTFTPTFGDLTNCTVSGFSATYLRVGSAVTVSGRVDINPTATGLVSFSSTLPISSTFTGGGEAGGTAAAADGVAEAVAIGPFDPNTKVLFTYTTTVISDRVFYYSYTYRIL